MLSPPSGEERSTVTPSSTGGPPMPSSSKQIPGEENGPLLDNLSVENVTKTLLRSIGVALLSGFFFLFDSQVTTATGSISTGALTSQFYNRPETSRSISSGSQSSWIKDYGAISERSIGIAYKILKDGSEGNEGVAVNILGSGIKLAETALTWPFELFNLVRNSAPLIVGFLLQHSLTLASVGYALYQGLAAALETLCAQSYGTGQYAQVGLHFQRCVILLMLTSVPVGFIWMSSPSILGLIVQEQKVVDLAGGYLRILFLGAPGYALFEAGKRYMQAQGISHASTAVLAFLAPLNGFMNFALVWGEFLGLGFGFYGVPISVVITNWLMPLCLAYYAIFIEGNKCWHPLTLRVFTNWGPILSLALPGIAMLWSEFISVELLTLFSSYFGTSTMAAQSILATIMSFIYQLPFGMSISSCAAVSQYIGAGNITSARRSAYVAMAIAIVFGVIDCIVLIAVREHAGKIFSRDKQVIACVAEALPVCAAFQVVDVLANVTGGILKGQGRQRIARMVQVPAYYGLAIPVSLYTSFNLGWGIRGLWAGCACALVVIAMVQTAAVLFCDWEKVVRGAGDRVVDGDAAGVQEDLEYGVRERLFGFGRG
ncbi:multidrug and toxin extrusion protein 1 [Tirmania nivea]|nr:multidrug and toxin extrusion protein 1 [Tirmania nivea]